MIAVIAVSCSIVDCISLGMGFTVQQVFEAAIAENDRVDYKRELSLDSEPNKNKLVKHIVAFANAKGGQIFIGIAEDDDSRPKEIYNHDIENVDSYGQQIIGLLNSRVEPRLAGVSIVEDVSYDNQKVVVINIAQGYNKPYAFKNNKDYQFFRRHHNTQQLLDLTEIRNMILSTASFSDRLWAYLDNRVQLQLDYFMSEVNAPTMMCHVIPQSIFTEEQTEEINSIRELPLLHAVNYSQFTWDIDGFYTGDSNSSLTKLLYDGTMELSRYFYRYSGNDDDRLRVDSTVVFGGLEYLFGYIKKDPFLSNLYSNGWLYLRILNTTNSSLFVKNAAWSNSHTVKRPNLIFPGVRIPQITEDLDIEALLLPVMNRLYNAYGYKKATLYK